MDVGALQGARKVLADELRDALLAVPGVASAQVAESEGTKPVVRVWLDGSRRDVEVEREVNRLIALSGYQSPEVTAVPPIEEPEEAPPALAVPPVASVAIEESASGLMTRVVAADGRVATEKIKAGFRGTEDAIVTAVATLRGVDTPQLLTVDDRETEGSTVVLVVLEAEDGRRVAGSAVVAGGRPFALARAAHAAMLDLR